MTQESEGLNAITCKASLKQINTKMQWKFLKEKTSEKNKCKYVQFNLHKRYFWIFFPEKLTYHLSLV